MAWYGDLFLTIFSPSIVMDTWNMLIFQWGRYVQCDEKVHEDAGVDSGYQQPHQGGCWNLGNGRWFRNPARKPVECDLNIPSFTTGFIHHPRWCSRRISEPSTVPVAPSIHHPKVGWPVPLLWPFRRKAWLWTTSRIKRSVVNKTHLVLGKFASQLIGFWGWIVLELICLSRSLCNPIDQGFEQMAISCVEGLRNLIDWKLRSNHIR